MLVTVRPSCFALSKTWQNVLCSKHRFSLDEYDAEASEELPVDNTDLRRMAYVICHGSPRFPKKSLWASRYLVGSHFIAQSATRKTLFSSSSSSIYLRAPSWWTVRNRCFFQSTISWIFCSKRCFSRSRVSSVIFMFSSIIEERRVNVSRRRKQASHLKQVNVGIIRAHSCYVYSSSWSWSHFSRQAKFCASLKPNVEQWSATLLLFDTCVR